LKKYLQLHNNLLKKSDVIEKVIFSLVLPSLRRVSLVLPSLRRVSLLLPFDSTSYRKGLYF
jgi:hypothetical protein